MSINKEETKKHPEDVFDDNFEVIYEGELPELPNDLGSDDYKDVLSNLSKLDTTSSVGIDYLEQNRTKTFINGGSSKTGRRHFTDRRHLKKKRSTASYLLQAATLLLIAVITGLLAVSFWSHKASYSDITSSIAGHNYILGAYYGISLFLLLIEWIAFLNVLLNGNTSKSHGLLSFLLIYFGSLLSRQYAAYLPSAPVALQGVREALIVYGALNRTLLMLCAAGTAVCVIRRFESGKSGK